MSHLVQRRSLLLATLLVAACAPPVPTFPPPAGGPPNAFAKGDRLRLQDFDTYSGVRTAERMAVITRLDAQGTELDDGRVRIDRSGRLAIEGPVSEHTFTAPLPPAATSTVGAQWQSMFVVNSYPAQPPSKADMTLVALEDRTIAGLQLSVARVQVRGMSERPANPVAGAWGAERFTGELLVDRGTGLVVEGKIRSNSRVLAFHRRLVQVIR